MHRMLVVDLFTQLIIVAHLYRHQRRWPVGRIDYHTIQYYDIVILIVADL